jgi:hypothetical protein
MARMEANMTEDPKQALREIFKLKQIPASIISGLVCLVQSKLNR